jgi:TIR domain
MTFPRRPIRAFLIYAHYDKEIVYSLYNCMIKDGIEVWLDAEKLLPGQSWKMEIGRAILNSDVVIVCLSRQFNKRKGYRHKELKIALEKATLLPDDEIFVIPIRLEECDMPESLLHLHRVDLFEVGGYKTLMRVLRVQGAEG